MFVRRSIPWSWTIYYAWPSMLYFLVVATAVFVLRRVVRDFDLVIPFEPVMIMATALAIFLGFKNNEAYGRWWEARVIWGLAVNFSRAWSRQVLTLLRAADAEREQLREMQRRLIYRHLAFIHALRVFLRTSPSYPQEETPSEPGSQMNNYDVCRQYLSEREFDELLTSDNPPETIIQRQGGELRDAYQRGWLTDIILVQLDQTLVELNHVQGRSERIKTTPLVRPYSYFQRLIVHALGTLLPFAFVATTGWVMIPLSLTVSVVFLALDLIGSRTEDPFENRMDDTPMSTISRTIERNLRSTLGEKDLPPNLLPKNGVLL
jgi:putative membrane protein